MQLAQAVPDELVGDVALELDDEAVVAERLLGRPRLDAGQVDVARRKLAEDLVAGFPAGPRAGSRRSSCGRDPSAPGRRPARRARSGSGCPRGPRSRGRGRRGRRASRRAAARPRRSSASRSSATRRARVGGRVRRARSRVRRGVVRGSARHCAVACGEREHARDRQPRLAPASASRSRWTSRTTSRWMSRSTSKTSWSSVSVDRAFDRVLERHERRVDLAGRDRARWRRGSSATGRARARRDRARRRAPPR